MSQQEIDAIAGMHAARRQALNEDNMQWREQQFAEAMRVLAQLEPIRDVFIIEAFKRGRERYRLDNEAIRPLLLPILHDEYDHPRRPLLPGGPDQRAYEEGIRERDKDRLPQSTIDAVDLLLRKDDAKELDAFLEGRPKSEVEKILAYIEKRKAS